MRIRGLAQRLADQAEQFAVRGASAFGIALLAACATVPHGRAPPPVVPPLGISTNPPSATLGSRLLAVAESQIGVPYRYGGTGQDGFDCSGLVFYAHAAIGLRVPRTVAAQSAAARPVQSAALAPGDLVFFRLHGRNIDHVGIYTGDGRFVHAPARGRVVRLAALTDPYYATRYVGAGRFWAGVASTTDGAPGAVRRAP